jgi:hypothetical protein
MAEDVDVARPGAASLVDRVRMRDEEGEIRQQFVEAISNAIHDDKTGRHGSGRNRSICGPRIVNQTLTCVADDGGVRDPQKRCPILPPGSRKKDWVGTCSACG